MLVGEEMGAICTCRHSQNLQIWMSKCFNRLFDVGSTNEELQLFLIKLYDVARKNSLTAGGYHRLCIPPECRAEVHVD